MGNTNFTKRNRTRWIFVTRVLMILGLLCFLYSGSLYDSVFFHEANMKASRELSFVLLDSGIAQSTATF